MIDLRDAIDLRRRSYLKELDFTPDELRWLVALAASLKAARAAGTEVPVLTGRTIALIFEKPSTRTRSAFEVAAHHQGAHVTYLGPDETQLGAKESIEDTARVLGRIFDGIEYRGFGQDRVERLGHLAGVPVWNGLTDEWHPTQMLADVLTLQEHCHRPPDRISIAYLGDGSNNTARSLLVTGALLGMDVRVAAPEVLWPPIAVRTTAERIATCTGGRVTVTADVRRAVRRVDAVYTDVWVSMGQPASEWDRRTTLLRAYRVDAAVMDAADNPNVRFMHCLPALHDRRTTLGEQLYQATGMDAMEVTDDVFRSGASVVFDQAENRLHTIKAVLVATMARSPEDVARAAGRPGQPVFGSVH